MSPRIPLLAFAADIVAVVVFAAIGRASHDESADVLGLAATAAPFAIGLVAAWATPVVRVQPVALRAGLVVLASTTVIGLLVRLVFVGRLPLPFAVVAALSLGVLLLGWRGLAALVARQAAGRIH